MSRRPVAIIQARMGSTRLPGKVLAEVKGRPLLWYLVSRLRHARTLAEIAIATTVEPGDDPIRAFAAVEGLRCYSGSESDVLDRYVQAARGLEADPVVRITADCPLHDPGVVDRLLEGFLAGRYDASSHAGTFPDGLDVEIFSRDALERAWSEAKLPSEREHVGPYIWNHPELFVHGHFDAGLGGADRDLSGYRWTVDRPEDLAFVTAVIEALDVPERCFDSHDIFALLAWRPELMALNSGIVRNEGYLKSLAADAGAAGRA